MENNLAQTYQKGWQKKILEKGRIESQDRVYFTLSNLFREIIHSDFKGNILDVGCGDGALVKLLNAKKNIKAEGIDIDQGVDFDKDKLPFQDNKFDIAIMYSVIEHLNNPGNILSEVKRILKPGGFLIIITSNFDLSRLFICDRGFYNDPTHIRPYNYVSIEYLMRLYNLKKRFIGLWTVKKSAFLWKLPLKLQFYIGALLPFGGQTKFAPSFLKGKSKAMLCVFQNE